MDEARFFLLGLGEALPQLYELTLFIFRFLGTITLIFAFLQFKGASEGDARCSYGEGVWEIIAAGLFFGLPAFAGTLIGTLSGGDTSPISYIAAETESPLLVIIGLAKLIGVFAIGLGINKYRHISNPQGKQEGGADAFWSGSMHIVFGAILANITVMLPLIANTLGFESLEL